MWPVKNKTIIGLKLPNIVRFQNSWVKNKTIIGLKYEKASTGGTNGYTVKNKTIIGLKCRQIIN